MCINGETHVYFNVHLQLVLWNIQGILVYVVIIVFNTNELSYLCIFVMYILNAILSKNLDSAAFEAKMS